MEEIKKRLLEEYDAVYLEIANEQLPCIPMYNRGNETSKLTFVGANGNWGLSTGQERNNGKPGDVAYRNSIEKMIDHGLISVQAIATYKGNMRKIVGGNVPDLRNVLAYLIKRIEDRETTLRYPDIEVSDDHSEGHVLKCYVNKFERDKSARDKCVKKFGWQCQVCGINFNSVYGSLGKDFIHVHHLVPLHTIKREYKVNPLRDLIPVCPNCHAMLHKLINKEKLESEEQYRNAVQSLKEKMKLL